MSDITVHTIDARGNVMLEVVRDYFHISASQMLLEIQGMLARLVRILNSKGINYADLKTALTPQTGRREIALIFDTNKMTEGWYGLPIHERLIPLLHQGSSRSILVGDYIDTLNEQEFLFHMLEEVVALRRDLDWTHSTMLYVVYITNLTNQMVDQIDTAFCDYAPYSGFADTTYSSRFKTYLSTILVNHYIQHRRVIICPHEDDRPDSDDVNMPGYPFEYAGFKVRSVPGDAFGVLLSYKIERAVTTGFESDIEFSLNAIHPNPLPLDDFEVIVEERKFEHLSKAKTESLRRAGFLDVGHEKLGKMIRAKIESNYVYSMRYLAEHGTALFNIMLEVSSAQGKPFRVLAGLSYEPDRKQLRLVTLF
jgi:hypothetical protein